MTNFEKFIYTVEKIIFDFIDVANWGKDDPEVIGMQWCECRERIEKVRDLYIAEESIRPDIKNSDKRRVTICDDHVTVETEHATCVIEI